MSSATLNLFVVSHARPRSSWAGVQELAEIKMMAACLAADRASIAASGADLKNHVGRSRVSISIKMAAVRLVSLIR